jgi:hypothetical protein
LKLGQSALAPTINIQTRSRLFLWYLSKKLDMTIYLFSSRSKARVFNSEGSGASIGLLHHIDSFSGISEYLVLAKSRHDPKDVMMIDPRPDPAFQSPYTAASFRSEKRRVNFQVVDRSEITRDDCDRAFQSAW